MMKRLFYCIDVLELLVAVLDFLNCRTDPDSLAMDLSEFKKLVARQRKALAKKCHPDVSEGNEDRMKEINNVVDFVNGLRVVTPVRRRPVFGYDFGMDAATANDTTTSFTYHWNA